MARIIVNPTSSSRREFALPRTLVSIGRDPSNDVVLPDAMVSRRHAVIEYRGSQYYIRDCNSSNGSSAAGVVASEKMLTCLNDSAAVPSAVWMMSDTTADAVGICPAPGRKTGSAPARARRR